MIENISLGKHFFKIAILLRDTLFLSSILTNSEVWYNITAGEIEELEMIDRTLLRRIFSVPKSTPSAGIYLETGCMRIGTIIKARRVNYLHYLAKLPQEEMLSKFFYHQWFVGGKYDWTTQVKNDLAELGLPDNLETLRKKSTFSWKTLVKKKTKEYELSKLLEIKKTKSKLTKLDYNKLEMQEYLITLDSQMAKNVFRFRVKMANFNGNFRGHGSPDACPLCGTHSDIQELCFKCPIILNQVKITENYENLYKQPLLRNLQAIF